MEQVHGEKFQKAKEAATNQKITEFLTKPAGSVDHQMKSKADKKFGLIRQLTLLCCRDNLPFSIVDGKGFRQFCVNRKIIETLEDMPHRTSLTNAGLDDIYSFVKSQEQKKLSNTPKVLPLIFDMWTDSHQQRPYISAETQFLDENFEFQSHLFSVKHFPGSHNGVTIKNILNDIVEECSLSEKRFISMNDNASNCKLATSLMDSVLDGGTCIDHSLHLLLINDLLENKNFASVKVLLDTIRGAYKVLLYRKEELKDLFYERKNAEIISKLEEMLQNNDGNYFNDY